MVFGLGVATCLGGVVTAISAAGIHDIKHSEPTQMSNRCVAAVFSGLTLMAAGFGLITYAVNQVAPFFH